MVKGIAHDLVPQHAAIVGVPCQREVGFAGLRLDQLSFGQLDGFEDRRLAVFVLIDSHRQIEFVLAGIGCKIVSPDHDGIDGIVLNLFKHPVSALLQDTRGDQRLEVLNL